MSDYNKNILVMVIGTILITTACHYLDLGILTWFFEIFGIIIWFIFSPFKFEDDV